MNGVPSTDVVDARDVLVAQAHHGARLAGEALLALRALAQRWQEDLERHERVEVAVEGRDDQAHAAPAEHARDLVLSGDDVADLERPHCRSLDPTKVQHVADGRRAVQSAQRGVFPGENATPFGMRDVASTASDICFAPRDVWLAQRRVWPAQRGVCSGLCVV